MAATQRREPKQIIGHPELASGAHFYHGDILYVSIAEAIYREQQGETVEIVFCPTDDQIRALDDLRAQAHRRWANDRLPDGWTRPPAGHLHPPQKD
jgi:hypothetical protein